MDAQIEVSIAALGYGNSAAWRIPAFPYADGGVFASGITQQIAEGSLSADIGGQGLEDKLKSVEVAVPKAEQITHKKTPRVSSTCVHRTYFFSE